MSLSTFLDGRVTLHAGDNLPVLKSLADCSIDSVVTDPPYALVSIVKRFANSPRNEKTENVENPYGRTGRGFMGKKWDNGERAFAVEFWAEVYRVLKPGGHVVAFSGTRTYHRMAVAIEDAGFEIRDQLQWLYGSGFPKSHNQDAEWAGWGTALKPAQEPIAFARKPLIGTVAENLRRHGTGALNIDGCRVAGGGGVFRSDEASQERRYTHNGSTNFAATPGPRGGDPSGRWPANIVHDGSDEVVSAFPEAPGQMAAVRPASGAGQKTGGILGAFATNSDCDPRGDAGTAARFFYSAKADAHDRIGSKHPTVKPVDLMQWLVRLVTPKGGVVLDPFAGTGTTGEAAWREGMRAVLIEREDEYLADIARRMNLADKPTKRAAVAKTKGSIDDFGPLFAGAAE